VIGGEKIARFEIPHLYESESGDKDRRNLKGKWGEGGKCKVSKSHEGQGGA